MGTLFSQARGSQCDLQGLERGNEPIGLVFSALYRAPLPSYGRTSVYLVVVEF